MTEKATALGVDAILSVTPYYNRPTARGHASRTSRRSPRPPTSRSILYNIPQRTGVDMPNDLLAELAQIDGIDGGQAGQRRRTSRRSTGSTSTPATTTCSPDVLDLGGAGGILIASHLVGDEMRAHGRREPERARARSRPACAPLYEALGR